VPALIDTIQHAAEQLRRPVKWIVLDTLSRALAGGNENSPEDMGALVRSSDMVRQACGGALSYVHHTGKDQARGARGHSLLRAATDTEVEISRQQGSGVSVVRVTKQRELEIGDDMGFCLEVIDLGTNRRGKPLTSCVAVEAGAEDMAGVRRQQKTARLTPIQSEFIRSLTNALAKHGKRRVPAPDVPPQVCVTHAEWKEQLQHDALLNREEKVRAGTLRQRWLTTPIDLRHKGLISFNETYAWLIEKRQEMSENVRP